MSLGGKVIGEISPGKISCYTVVCSLMQIREVTKEWWSGVALLLRTHLTFDVVLIPQIPFDVANNMQFRNN